MILGCSICFGQGIHFITSEKNALLIAKAENKLIFIDVTADWCKPCQLMLEDLEKDTALVNFFNTNFVNLQINVVYNKFYLSSYNIRALPTIMYMDKNGEVLSTITGYYSIDNIVKTAKTLVAYRKFINNVEEKGDLFYFASGEEEYIEMFGKMIYEMTGHYRDFILNTK